MKQILLEGLSIEWKKEQKRKHCIACYGKYLRQQKIRLHVNLSIRRKKYHIKCVYFKKKSIQYVPKEEIRLTIDL